ncbi:MAG: hypothetical protein Q8S26_03860 [Azonexus sp.]|nr:hypothetical protein [Azonexus sp.]
MTSTVGQPLARWTPGGRWLVVLAGLLAATANFLMLLELIG